MIDRNRLKRCLFIAAGSLCLVLGAIGILVPVLPTTPFLLLTAFFYMRSSARLYDWLIHHRVFGLYIYNYVTYRAIPKATKIGAIIFLWLTLGLSILIVDILYVRILLAAIGIGVTLHIASLRTLAGTPSQSAADKAE